MGVNEYGIDLGYSRKVEVLGTMHVTPCGSSCRTPADWGCSDRLKNYNFVDRPAATTSTQASCFSDAIAQFGDSAKVRGRLQVGSWGHVPPGCGVWPGPKGAAHWNTNTASVGTDKRWEVVKPQVTKNGPPQPSKVTVQEFNTAQKKLQLANAKLRQAKHDFESKFFGVERNQKVQEKVRNAAERAKKADKKRKTAEEAKKVAEKAAKKV